MIDWERCQRGNSWTSLLERIQKSSNFKFEITEFRLAEMILAAPGGDRENGLNALKFQDVLIFNWDVINGDPDFGAHLAQTWICHHRPELLLWVRKGNLLSIESQTRFGVPSQAAYDAAVGKGELPVLHLEHLERANILEKLHGNQCRKSPRFPKRNGFDDVNDPLGLISISDKKPFSDTATVFLTDELCELLDTRKNLPFSAGL